jgi:Protein of unknown function (DUF1566)/Putative Ig domain
MLLLKSTFFTFLFLMGFGILYKSFAQTPVPMGSQPSLTYTENFDSISSWTNGFAAGVGANRFASVLVNSTGTIPSATRITTSTANFVIGSSGGVQRGIGNIQLLSTGATDNTSSTGIDFFMDFTGVNAGTISFDAATVFNSTGNRKGSLRVYATVDNITWTEITGTNLPYVATNNVAGSASITNIALPSIFNGSASARLRFYYHIGTGGTTGSRPKISIDNLSIVAGSPALSPIVSSDSSIAQVGMPFSYFINATNSPTMFSASGLPVGLSINTFTGEIYGSPTNSGTSIEIPIQASNSNGIGNGTLTLTINPGYQTIIFNALNPVTFGTPPFGLIATGGSSSSPITFVSTDSSVAIISGSTCNIVGIGSTNIIASQAADTNYLAALDVTQVLTVLPQTSATMTLQNVIQTSPSIFEYDIILTNSGNTLLGLQGYTCGINHATGMRNGGTLTHTFLSRDPALSALPNITTAYTASTNHLRLLCGNTSAGNEYNLLPGNSIRIATMRVSNSVQFPTDFIPDLALQMLIAIGKTPCVATCIASPPGISYALNGVTNLPSSGTLQALNGIVTTPCLSLNSSVPFSALGSQTSLINCNVISNIEAQITLNGTGSNSFPGLYSVDGGQSISYSINPFNIPNLSVGIHTVTVVSANGCTSSTLLEITQGILDSVSISVYPNPIICYGDSIILNATGANSIIWSDPQVINGISFIPANTSTYTVTGTNNYGCTATSQVTITVNPKPIINVTPTGATTFCDGSSVVLNTILGNGLNYQWYSSTIPIIGATSNSFLVSESGNYWLEAINQYNCTSASSQQSVTVNECDVNLNLKLFYQGYYVGMSSMTPALFNEGVTLNQTITDSILIELHSTVPPYGLVLSKQAILQTDGHAICTFEYMNGNYYLADSYYVAIHHRNGLTTWSANPISFTSTSVVYDFTTNSNKAYGENMMEVDPGIWAFFSGELNSDENIDLLDNSLLENDIANFSFGYYSTDLNGDGNSDLLDVPILEMNIYSFIYSSQPAWSGILPSVNTNPVNSITAGTAVSGGSILSDGGSPILQKGLCWSLNPHPTVADSKTMDGAGGGSFTSNIDSLLPMSTYYVRSYASNWTGTVYGNEVVFNSGPLVIGQNYQGGKVAYILQSGDPGYDANEMKGLIVTPTDLGIAEWGCFETVINGADGYSIGTGLQNTVDIVAECSTTGIAAKLCNDLLLNGYSDWYLPSKDELFQLSLNSGLIGGIQNDFYWSSTEYDSLNAWLEYMPYTSQAQYAKFDPHLVRATRTFSTQNSTGIITSQASFITNNSAVCGGMVTMQSGAPVIVRGICWSTNSNPTIALSTKTIDGSGKGSFSSNLSGLNSGITYHVRAYATTSTGTVYGNDITFTTLSLSIGDSYGGGKVAYILQPGDIGYIAGEVHGLIAAPSDQGTTIQWYNGSNIVTGATDTAMGTGHANTNTIVSIQGNGTYAAKLCYDLVLNGYSDWYLPSKVELHKLYLNQTAIGGFLSASAYWSSSEIDNYYAWPQDFEFGYQYATVKYGTIFVRAVRSF